MARIVLKRILHMIPVLLVVVSVAFFVTRILPSDPAVMILGAEASAEDIAQLRDNLGLNGNILTQYVSYLFDLLHGNFGKSYVYKKPVINMIMNVLPNTVTLAVGGVLVATVLGIPLGILAATHRNRLPDYCVSAITLIGVSTPLFWLGLVLTLFFSVKLRWLPVMGIGNLENGIWDYISHMILPILTISTVPLANVLLITRSSVINVLEKDLYKSLIAFGIPKYRILGKHVLKNALPAIINVVGIQLASALTGAILTETVFNWPGLGKLTADAITGRDYNLVQGCILFMAVVYIIVNLITDIITYCVNPQFAENT